MCGTLEHNHPPCNISPQRQITLLQLWQAGLVLRTAFTKWKGAQLPLHSISVTRQLMSHSKGRWQSRHMDSNDKYKPRPLIFFKKKGNRDDYLRINNHVSACQQIIGTFRRQGLKQILGIFQRMDHASSRLDLIMKWQQKQTTSEVLEQ